MGLPEETKTAPSLQSQIWAGISTGSNRTVQKKVHFKYIYTQTL